jgi:hypothetical protein
VNTKFLPALAVAAATSGVFALADAASAVTITQPIQSTPITQTATPFTQTQPPNPILVPRFTPTPVPFDFKEPGLLSQVFLGLDGTLTGSVTLTNTTTVARRVSAINILNSNLDVFKGTQQVLGVTFNGQVPGFTSQSIAPGATVIFPFSVNMSDLPDGSLKLFCDKNKPGGDQACLDMFTIGNVPFTAQANAFVVASTQSGVTQSSTASALGNLKVQYVQHNTPCVYPGDYGIPNCQNSPPMNGTPEPSTLLGLGMLTLGGLTSRRKN